MKYFNKEWYGLMQKMFMTSGIKGIADKEYTDEEIREIYNKELNKEIKRAYEEYNTPPDYSFIEELENEEEEFDPENWILINEKSGETKEPNSKEEVIESLLIEKEQTLDGFNNREPFNEKEVVDDFEQRYKISLKEKEEFPKWVYEQVDKRLIALGLLHKSILKKLREEEKECKKKFNRIEKEANSVFRKQKVPEEIFNNFHFHDDRIIKFDKKRNSYEMILENYENEIIKVVFEEAEIIELEKINFKNCYFLYEELYSLKDGYEVHMMVDAKGLKYITLRCKDIKFE